MECVLTSCNGACSSGLLTRPRSLWFNKLKRLIIYGVPLAVKV